jgi:Tfp pilus assembly protein PilO
LIGEWPLANILLGVAFLVAALGVVGLGWWVMRADHLNRRFEHPGSDESSET